MSNGKPVEDLSLFEHENELLIAENMKRVGARQDEFPAVLVLAQDNGPRFMDVYRDAVEVVTRLEARAAA